MIPVFYETLLRELPDRELRVERIVRGVAWTAAVLSWRVGSDPLIAP